MSFETPSLSVISGPQSKKAAGLSFSKRAHNLLEAISRKAPEIFLGDYDGPYWKLVQEKNLETLYESAVSGDIQDRMNAMSAMARVLKDQPRDAEWARKVQAIETETYKGLLISKWHCIAALKDEAFLEGQLALLGDENPELQALGAKLLGYGRFERAAPALIQLASPKSITVAQEAIWALGEMKSVEALAHLELAFKNAFLPDSCLEAIGKIAHVSSLPLLESALAFGPGSLKVSVLKAMGNIIQAHKKTSYFLALHQERLSKELTLLLEPRKKDEQSPIPVYALLCLQFLGIAVEKSCVEKSLGCILSDKAFADFLRPQSFVRKLRI